MSRLARLAAVLGWLLVAGILVPLIAAPAAAAADSDGSLSMSGPDSAAVGDIIDVIIDVPPATAGFEAVLDFDRAALDFGGFYVDDEGTQLLSVTNLTDRIPVAAYGCSSSDCSTSDIGPVGSVTARFSVVEPGAHQVRLGRAVVIATSGAVTDVETPETVTISVADDPTATAGSTVSTLLVARGAVSAQQADQTGDGSVTGADLTEVALAWAEVRRRGEPCTLESGRLAGADVDGSGCLDIADLIGVASQVGPDPIVPGAAGSKLGLDGVDAEDGAQNDVQNDVGAAAAPIPMVVNSTSDEWDANLNNGVCNTPSGVCSLRAAILQANRNVGPDIIHFNIPGSGPHQIVLGDQLPTINDTTGGLIIDGYTQPGASVNTSEQLSNAVIKIEIIGRGYNGYSSLVIASPDNTVRGLAVYRTFSNFRLTGSNSTGNRIVGNFIGTNAAATYHIPGARNQYQDQAGVEVVSGASYNRIGTPALADRNVISGNPYSGVRVNHSATTGNIIQNNLVGLTPSGNTSLYTYVAGIDVQWGAKETLIGGYEDRAGNVVTGNTNYGIDLSHSSKNNRVIRNYMGTDATGDRVGSGTGNLIGLAIKDNTVGNLIEYNVMGGNNWHGVWHRHNFTGTNTFRHNRIGLGVNGGNIGNVLDGISLTGHDDTYTGNIVTNNRRYGIAISNYNGGNGFSPPEYTQRNEITNNSIFSNASSEIVISSAQNNISAPSISSVSTGFAAGSTCSGCRVELYTGSDGGRQMIASTVASSQGSWSISNAAIRNVYLTALTISSNEDTSQFGNTVAVGSPFNGSAPIVSPISDRQGQRWQWASFGVQASDPNGKYLTYTPLNLPAGVSIDHRTGVISGRPGSVGPHTVIIRVDNGSAATQVSFKWTIAVPNGSPTIDAIADQAGTVGDQVSLQATGSDPDGDALTFTATGLPGGVSIDGSGQLGGTLNQSGTFSVQVTAADPSGSSATTSFAWTVDPGAAPFACSISGSTLSWTDQGASRYYIRQLLNGVDSYVGSSDGLSFGLSGPAGQYTVRHWSNGRPIDATCDA